MIIVILISTALVTTGCGQNPGSPHGGAPDSGPGSGDDGGARDGSTGPGCVNLACKQVSCPGGGTTSISGTVYIPAGTLPLPNVLVYVPNAALEPIGSDLSCDRCDEHVSGNPLVRTFTNERGEFVLGNMPVGQEIPVVFQVGKWRRVITLPAVEACVDNPLLDPEMTRLPRNQSEGDLPRIALTTGGSDALECLVRKIGVDDAEITTEAGSGRVHLYAGARATNSFAPTMNDGASFTPAPTFWDDLEAMLQYDIIIHSCEGTSSPTNKSVEATEALKAYADRGGRVFASHWHNYWLEFGPDPLPSVATWNRQSNPSNPMPAFIDMSFDKGRKLAEWLLYVGGSTTLGELEIRGGRRTVEAVDTSRVDRFIYNEDLSSVQYFSFETPLEAPATQRCGRVVFSDIHVSSGDDSSPSVPFPTGCTTTNFLAQEKALVFLFFDLASCIGFPVD